MATVDRRACVGNGPYGMPKSDGLKATGLDCAYYVDRVHLYICRCSDFVRLVSIFELHLVKI